MLLRFFKPRRSFFSLKLPTNLKEYQEKRVVGFTACEMFSIAANVWEYPEFVPWCQHGRSSNSFIAQLRIGFPPVCETYTSRISVMKPTIVRSVCTDNRLFKTLESTWQFNKGHPDNVRSCTLMFTLAFQFNSVFHSSLAHHFFDHVVETIVIAFLKRAEAKYGSPSFDHYKDYTVLKKVR
ncbi:unnamed protein product [Thelazia callipaeda]|uniref:Polyketide_cyc domain-containing protein n=1 Tax=Thelazia callipaeda TaxID=103827 RepID=A0A0N5D5M2_THECL|nr:unnamed protein product [Thelazia callipaeda]